MPTICQVDPLNIREVMDLISSTSCLRMLALYPRGSKGRLYRMYAYALKRPDAALEYDLGKAGAMVVGYYTKAAEPAAVMADIAFAMGEI